MNDQAELEGKYFIDSTRYNCPFCNVRAAHYTVEDNTHYYNDPKKPIYVYIVKCSMCSKRSIHLSYLNWETADNNVYSRGNRLTNPFYRRPNNFNEALTYNDKILDDYFFFHQPTSFFTIDDRIPEKIRELVSEAEGCKEMNFMTGASGSLRRAIYKFLRHEEAEGEHYEEKIKWLKTKYPRVDDEYFDAILDIKDMNDQDMHEEDWEPFKSNEFSYLIGCFKEVLTEIYVEPKKRNIMKQTLLEFKGKRVKK